MPIFIAALLGLICLAIVLYPLLAPHGAPEDGGLPAPVAEMADRERLARAALREVEFDHSLGNLDDGDYAALRERYERRALAALKVRYQREQELDARIEHELAELRARASSALSEGSANADHQDERDQRTDGPPAKTRPARPTAPSPQGPRARRRKGM